MVIFTVIDGNNHLKKHERFVTGMDYVIVWANFDLLKIWMDLYKYTFKQAVWLSLISKIIF